ncbi:hypothetical protein D3C86_1424760 [compost metagenome]
MDGPGLGRRIGGISPGGAQAAHGTDQDQAAASRLQRRSQFLGAGHEAVEVHLHDPTEGLGLEFASPVLHRALRQDHHIEGLEGRDPGLDRSGLGDVQRREGEGGEGFGGVAVVRPASAGACDGDAAAPGGEGLGAGQADAARSADDQDGLVGEVEIHGGPKAKE